jgi:hypothetical protein
MTMATLVTQGTFPLLAPLRGRELEARISFGFHTTAEMALIDRAY